MKETLITKKIKDFLQNKEFINVATCDFDGRPNVAPKFMLKIEDDYIYLVDYIIGTTYRNLKINPKISLSTVDLDTLTGYQINGSAKIIEEKESENLLEEFHERQLRFCVARIIKGVQKAEKHEHFETAFPERIVVFKVKAAETVEIIPTGELKRRQL